MLHTGFRSAIWGEPVCCVCGNAVACVPLAGCVAGGQNCAPDPGYYSQHTELARKRQPVACTDSAQDPAKQRSCPQLPATRLRASATMVPHSGTTFSPGVRSSKLQRVPSRFKKTARCLCQGSNQPAAELRATAGGPERCTSARDVSGSAVPGSDRTTVRAEQPRSCCPQLPATRLRATPASWWL